MAKIFVSYTAADRQAAEWIGGTLRKHGHEAFLHDWEVGPGQNIARWMELRIREADHLLGVFSDAYAQGIYSNSERWAAYWQDPEGRDGFLLPIEISPVTEWPPLVRPLRRLSLVGLGEASAEKALLSFLKSPAPPDVRPPFPGRSAPLSEVTQEQGTAGGPAGPTFSGNGNALPKTKSASPATGTSPIQPRQGNGEGSRPITSSAEKVPNPRDRTAFQRWLQSKPQGWSVIIAARAALRLLPLLSPSVLNSPDGTMMMLPIFRALSVAWLTAVYPGRDTKEAASRAVEAMDNAATAFQALEATLRRVPGRPPGPGGESVLARSLTFRYASSAAIAAIRAAAAPNAEVASEAISAAVASTFSAPALSSASTIFATVEADAQLLQHAQRSLSQVARSALWPTKMPDGWKDLAPQGHQFVQDLPRLGDDWRVWADWYGEIISGSLPSPERGKSWCEAFTDVDEPLPWDEGSKAVNLAIKARLDALMPPTDVSVPPLPEQATGPHYRANDDGRIDRAPAADMDAEGNDLRTIESLRPLILRCAADLRSLLPINQFPQLIQEIERYEAALKPGDGRATEWGEVWGQGVFLQSAAAAAERQIADRMLPEMEDPAKTALASLLTLHGPLILATTAGARMTEQATHFAMSAQQQVELRRAAEKVIAQLEATPDIITSEALATAEPAVEHMGEGPRPERSSLYGLVNIKNISIVLLGGAAVATPTLLGMLLGGPAGVGFGAPFSFLAAEVIKKNPTFLALVQQLNLPLEKALDKKVWERQVRKFSPFREFVIRNQEPLRNIARTTPELNWMGRYIDFITTDHGSPGGE